MFSSLVPRSDFQAHAALTSGTTASEAVTASLENVYPTSRSCGRQWHLLSGPDSQGAGKAHWIGPRKTSHFYGFAWNQEEIAI